MRNLPAVLFLALAACGGGGEETPQPVDSQPADSSPPDTQPPPPDSQVLDLACAANTTPPATAAKSVTASGAANMLTTQGLNPAIEPLPDATIQVCIGDCQGENELATTTSAADPCGTTGCEFSVAADTGGAPIDGYLRVSRQGVRTSNIFPSEPIAADVTGIPAIAIDPAVLVGLAMFGLTQNEGQGMLIVRVSDCTLLTGVEGATPSVTDDDGTAVGNDPFDVGGFDPALAGTFLVLNVPPGTVTVGASVNGTNFRPHDVLVVADELTATQVTPGFAAP